PRSLILSSDETRIRTGAPIRPRIARDARGHDALITAHRAIIRVQTERNPSAVSSRAGTGGTYPDSVMRFRVLGRGASDPHDHDKNHIVIGQSLFSISRATPGSRACTRTNLL